MEPKESLEKHDWNKTTLQVAYLNLTNLSRRLYELLLSKLLGL